MKLENKLICLKICKKKPQNWNENLHAKFLHGRKFLGPLLYKILKMTLHNGNTDSFTSPALARHTNAHKHCVRI